MFYSYFVNITKLLILHSCSFYLVLFYAALCCIITEMKFAFVYCLTIYVFESMCKSEAVDEYFEVVTKNR